MATIASGGDDEYIDAWLGYLRNFLAGILVIALCDILIIMKYDPRWLGSRRHISYYSILLIVTY